MLDAMMLAAALQAEASAGPIPAALRYLARHQSEDGAWGRRAASCACPEEPPSGGVAPPIDEAGRARVAALIAELDHADPAARDDAEEALFLVGLAAEPQLEAAAGGPEARARALRIRRRMRGGGSCDDIELTALALLGYLGAGYQPRSVELFDDRQAGEILLRGLQWLAARPEPPAGSAAQALRTLALAEAYGIGGEERWAKPAGEAVRGLGAGPGPAKSDDRALLWRAMAFQSARVAGLGAPGAAAVAIQEEVRRRREADPGSVFRQAADVLVTAIVLGPKPGADPGDLDRLDPASVDPGTGYGIGLALFHATGGEGNAWRRFQSSRRSVLQPRQVRDPDRCDRGSWPALGTRGRISFAACSVLLNELCK